MLCILYTVYMYSTYNIYLFHFIFGCYLSAFYILMRGWGDWWTYVKWWGGMRRLVSDVLVRAYYENSNFKFVVIRASKILLCYLICVEASSIPSRIQKQGEHLINMTFLQWCGDGFLQKKMVSCVLIFSINISSEDVMYFWLDIMLIYL